MHREDPQPQENQTQHRNHQKHIEYTLLNMRVLVYFSDPHHHSDHPGHDSRSQTVETSAEGPHHLGFFSIEDCYDFPLFVNDVEEPSNDCPLHEDNHDKLDVVHIHSAQQKEPPY
jgi:hypothetical protein